MKKTSLSALLYLAIIGTLLCTYYYNKKHLQKLPKNNIIYLDYQASTPMDKRVIKAMDRVMVNHPGNPNSNNAYGIDTKKIVDQSRLNIANVIGANAEDIIFTSGATESNNAALKGVARFYKSAHKNHIITSIFEHKCILESCKELEKEGFEITYLKPDKDGIISPEQISQAIKPNTIMVSIIGLHNEIGVIQDLVAIGKITKEKGIIFHTDCAQAFGKINLNVEEMNIDLMSISGHKIYGPKGIGALYIRGNPKIRLKPIINGGGQEKGLRSGTLPTALIKGLGEAAKIAQSEQKEELARISILSNMMKDALLKIDGAKINGDLNQGYPGNINISFEGIKPGYLSDNLKKVAISAGSACNSGQHGYSHSLDAISALSESSDFIRIGIGRFTTKKEIEKAILIISETVKIAREKPSVDGMHGSINTDISPDWEHSNDFTFKENKK